MACSAPERIQDHFKNCPNCGAVWATREEFLSDADLVPVGYQVYFEDLQAGLFLFNHSCGTTMAIEAGFFFDLHDGQIFRERATGTAECGGHCLYKDDMDPCPARCDCAFARDVLQTVRQWPKTPSARLPVD